MVVVVGAGVIGLAIARAVRARGHRVLVLERETPGAGASSGAGGLLAPQLEAHTPGPFLDACIRSRAMYPRWVQGVEASSGQQVGYRPSGIVQLCFDENGLHAAEATRAWQSAAGLRAELLLGPEVRRVAAAASSEALGALWLPDDHQVEPRRLMPALVAAAKAEGVELRRGEVRGLSERSGRVNGVELVGERLPADHVVLAAGPWSGLVAGAPVGPALAGPVRGQMLELRPETPVGAAVLGHGHGYLIPREDGRVTIGSTKELGGFELATSEEGIGGLRALAERVCPALKGARELGRWSALRPCAPDELPVWGRGPLEGSWVATGHYRNGILLAPLTGELVAKALSGIDDPLWGRFGWERLRAHAGR